MDTGKNRASRPGHLEMLALCQGIPKTHRRNHRTWKTSSMVYHSERVQTFITVKIKGAQGRVRERWIPSCPSLVDPLGQQFILPHRRDMCQVMPTGDANLGRSV